MTRESLRGDSEATPSKPAAAFLTTHWTRVVAAQGESPEAKIALSELCEAYYAPVHAFVRATTRSDDEARDLTHDFFVYVLEGAAFRNVEPKRARFRSYLLGAVKHFLMDQRRKCARQKRGGGAAAEPLADEVGTAAGVSVAAPEAECDRRFDREWAVTVMARALERLAVELAGLGKERQFEVLKPWLAGGASVRSQAEAAAALGLNEGAVKVAIHRLRRRFREVVRAQISQTLSDPAAVRSELNHLVEVLSEPYSGAP